MKRTPFNTALFYVSVFVMCCSASVNSDAKDTNHGHECPYFLKGQQELYAKSPREAAMAWFDNARLGMFIHWGVWGKKGWNSAWAMYYYRIPLETYEAHARTVNPSGFDATAIVQLAKDSGMNYITFVAKHHDGFCLWNSQATKFDSMDFPMKRDFLKELARECRKQQIPLFIYYSIGIDWTHPYFLPKEKYSMGRPHYAHKPEHYKYRQPQDFEKYRDFCKQQLTELCTNYGPIAGFWFDPLGGVLANSDMFKMQEFYDLIHAIQPHALILFKTGATGTEDVIVGERKLESISMHYKGQDEGSKRIRRLADAAWNRNFRKKAEIAVTSQGTWEWTPDAKCASVEQLWKMLETASDNNANLLLNVGLKPDGSIPEDVSTNFRALGDLIRKQGYPKRNKTNYLELRKDGATLDNREKVKTAR